MFIYFFDLNKRFKEHLFIKQMSVEVQLPTGYKTIDIVSSVYSYKSNSKTRIVQKNGGRFVAKSAPSKNPDFSLLNSHISSQKYLTTKIRSIECAPINVRCR